METFFQIFWRKSASFLGKFFLKYLKDERKSFWILSCKRSRAFLKICWKTSDRKSWAFQKNILEGKTASFPGFFSKVVKKDCELSRNFLETILREDSEFSGKLSPKKLEGKSLVTMKTFKKNLWRRNPIFCMTFHKKLRKQNRDLSWQLFWKVSNQVMRAFLETFFNIFRRKNVIFSRNFPAKAPEKFTSFSESFVKKLQRGSFPRSFLSKTLAKNQELILKCSW